MAEVVVHIEAESLAQLDAEMVAHLKTWVESSDPFPVDFDKAWHWLGYSDKATAKRALSREFSASRDYSAAMLKSTGGRPSEQIKLSKSCFEQFSLSAPTARGKQVRLVYIDIKNKHMTLRDAIVRGDVELRSTAKDAGFEGYVDERHYARAKAIETYHDQQEAIKAKPQLNHLAAHLHTNSNVSWAALGMTPSALKKELEIPKSESARSYMDVAQLYSVSHTQCAVVLSHDRAYV